MKELRAFYFIVTAFQTWGRGLTLKEALKAAKVTRKSEKYIINIGIVKPEATDEQLSNLVKCWNVNDMGGINFYTDGQDLEKDQAMAKELFLGWVSDESYIK